eukprot:gene7616-6967_t
MTRRSTVFERMDAFRDGVIRLPEFLRGAARLLRPARTLQYLPAVAGYPGWGCWGDADALAAPLARFAARLLRDGGAGLSDVEVLLFPKGEGGKALDPLAQRPISLSHAIYRVVARWIDRRLRRALGLDGCRAERALSAAQCGYQADLGVDDVLVACKLLLEQSARAGSAEAQLLLLGWRKCYDLMEPWLVVAVLRRVGVSPRLLGLVESLIAGRRARFRTAYGTTDAFVPARGLAQGCPL